MSCAEVIRCDRTCATLSASSNPRAPIRLPQDLTPGRVPACSAARSTGTGAPMTGPRQPRPVRLGQHAGLDEAVQVALHPRPGPRWTACSIRPSTVCMLASRAASSSASTVAARPVTSRSRASASTDRAVTRGSPASTFGAAASSGRTRTARRTRCSAPGPGSCPHTARRPRCGHRSPCSPTSTVFPCEPCTVDAYACWTCSATYSGGQLPHRPSSPRADRDPSSPHPTTVEAVTVEHAQGVVDLAGHDLVADAGDAAGAGQRGTPPLPPRRPPGAHGPGGRSSPRPHSCPCRDRHRPAGEPLRCRRPRRRRDRLIHRGRVDQSAAPVVLRQGLVSAPSRRPSDAGPSHSSANRRTSVNVYVSARSATRPMTRQPVPTRAGSGHPSARSGRRSESDVPDPAQVHRSPPWMPHPLGRCPAARPRSGSRAAAGSRPRAAPAT
jgi:hypothetical protein